jgi:hypothetical protein
MSSTKGNDKTIVMRAVEGGYDGPVMFQTRYMGAEARRELRYGKRIVFETLCNHRRRRSVHASFAVAMVVDVLESHLQLGLSVQMSLGISNYS